MAVTGTALKVKQAAQYTLVTITGLTGDTNTSPVVFGEAMPYSTAQITVTGTAPTNVQLQGGNDSTAANFAAIGTAITSFPALVAVSPGDLPFLYHNWKVTGGDATTSITITEIHMGTHG